MHSERWNNRVNTRAVSKSGIDHWRRVVQSTTQRAKDLVDCVEDMGVISEAVFRKLDNAPAFKVDLVEGVDHHFGDGWIAQQWLERTESDHFLVEHCRQTVLVM